jgi:signal transduction histidine kinase
LVISPPFWHRWWFYSLCALLLLSGLFFVYQYNMNQFRVRLLLRDKIARDLHDDIGSTLSGINIFSKLALQRLNSGGGSSRELLEKISEKSENTLDALSDIVWSINTKNDGLNNFLAKAREYLAELLEVREIAYKIEASAEMEHVKIGMDVRKEIYLIFKEAVYNAAKYAGCTCVTVTMTRRKDTCTLTICDNGQGFDVCNIPAGNGIENMRHRAKKIGAAFEIESRTGEGTTINLRFHIPRFR